jgi:hypothetical protein
VAKLHSALVTTAHHFLLGRGDIGGRGLEVDGSFDPARQQLMVENTDASSDVEDGLGCDSEVIEAFQDQPGSSPRPAASVVGQFCYGPSRCEVAVGRYAMAARHRGLVEDDLPATRRLTGFAA